MASELPNTPGVPRFCPECGAGLAVHRVGGEPRNHWVCPGCGALHHEHPKIVVTCFVAWQSSLLWVRRAIDPKRGLWAIPGGFLEPGEPLRTGAARELREEAGLVVDPDRLELYMMGTLTFINQIYVGFRTHVDDPGCQPGRESLECAFFDRHNCPWNSLAYPEVNESIEQAYDDLDRGSFEQWHVEMTADSYERCRVNTGPLTAGEET